MKLLRSFVLLMVVISCEARELVRSWTFAELLDSSDLVVVAVAVKVEKLQEVSELPNIFALTKEGGSEPLLGQGINTTFEVLAVLKAASSLKCFILHHYAVAPLPVNGPNLVSFEPSEQGRFLMFLKKDKDGRYIPVSGQTDPAFSVKKLERGLDGDRLTNRCSGPANSAGR